MREVKQYIYPHGGSRILYEDELGRDLLADTYMDESMAKAVKEFIVEYLAAAHQQDKGEGDEV